MALIRMLSRRRLLTVVAASAGMLVVGCSRNQPAPEPTDGATSAASPHGATATDAPQASTLPFSLSGMPVTVAPVEVKQTAQPAELSPQWSFGGDYAQIGVLPLSTEEVFGSASSNPNALMSYAAAILTAEGAETLTSEPPEIVDPADYFEPQDGSATADWIVWRAATVNIDSELSSVIDNWQLWAYGRTTGSGAVLIGTAEELNGTTETPAGPLEVVPTTDGTDVYWASAVYADDRWERQVLCYALDGRKPPSVVAAGDLPAAVAGGVLFAVPDTEGALTTLAHWNRLSETAETILSITSTDSSWQITGVWAAGNHRALAVSSTTAGAGTYIGLWDEEQPGPATWLHAPSTVIIGSAGATRFAWGSGSDGQEADMYAVAWDGTDLVGLGEAIGYSRPTLSPDGATVLVPASDGMTAASWTVASF
ncbi:hypothetical protein SAMN05216355_101348 [Actinomyces ruminicola]|uniref:Lipoprotein LpqB beta-propeller domain-containing protein n=2 Tax=Actinomyces ruminicola TaxID=332524 RepID=A0A1G9ZQP5_9ACTO|nr:hypothetical protein SAMN05216355_101348 [Actinomyces ruminicola]